MTAPVRPTSHADDRAQLFRLYKEALAEPGADKAEIDSVFRAKLAESAPGGRVGTDAGGGLEPYGWGNRALSGATFGFGDEIAGFGRAVADKVKGEPGTFAELRAARTAQERERAADYARENPGTALAADIGGSLVTGGAAGKVGLKLLSKVAPRAIGETLARRVVAGAGVGALTGGVAGVGGAEGDLSERMHSAVPSAIAGGVGGAAMPLLGAAGRRVLDMTGSRPRATLQGSKDALDGIQATAAAEGRTAPVPMRQRIAAKLGAEPIEARADDYLIDAVGAGNQKLDDVAAAARGAGDHVALPDLLDRTGKSRIRGARTVATSGTLDDFLEARQEGAGQRIGEKLRNAVGDPELSARTLDRLEGARATATAPLYEKALEGRSVTDPRVLDLLQRPALADAYKKAVRMAKNDGEHMPGIDDILGAGKKLPSELDDVPMDPELSTTLHGSTRTASGGLRDVKQADNEALMRELVDLTTRQQRDIGLSQYRMVESQGATDRATTKIMAATKTSRGTSVQAEAQRRVELANGVIDRITGELDRRNVDWQEVLARRQGGKGAQLAREASEQELETALRPVAGRGTVSVPEPEEAATLPTLTAKQVQRWKLAVDDDIAHLEGKTGGTKTHEYKQLIGLRDQVEGLLYEHADGWKDAQNTYARMSAPIDAVQAAKRGIPERGVRGAAHASPDEMQYALDKVTRGGTVPEARTAYRSAAVEEVFNKLADPDQAKRVARTYRAGTPQRAKLLSLVDDADARAELEQALDREWQMQTTKSFVQTGSSTPLINEEAAAMKDAVSFGDAAKQGKGAVASWAVRETAARAGRGLSRDLANDVTKKATQTGKSLEDYLVQLQSRAGRRASERGRAAVIGGARAGALSGAAARTDRN